MLEISHRPQAGMCPVNGIRDLLHWRCGLDLSNSFLWGLGQGGGFAYLRFKSASPPRQVYTGIATPRQHRYLAGLFAADFKEWENRTFQFSWAKACAALASSVPPILGPLDMFHLPFYPQIYHKRHIPIHFLLLVGCDEGHAFLLDTGQPEVQTLALAQLQLAWDVNVPAMGKRNRLIIFQPPTQLPPLANLIRRALVDNCRTMLYPPVSMLGVPAMRKLAHELPHWEEELGKSVDAACIDQACEYLNSPPDLYGSHFTAGRDLTIAFLEESAAITRLDFSDPIACLRRSMALVPALADSLRMREFNQAAEGFLSFADAEQQAYEALGHLLQDS